MILDLFAGPGGWDVAAAELGMRPIGIEHDAAACATRVAAGHLTIRADVSTIATEPFVGKLIGLIASPPCPTFSMAGKGEGREEMPLLIAHVHACATGWRDYEAPEDADPRSRLVLEPLRFIIECEPTWVALEQVPDVMPVWIAYEQVLRLRGYSAWCGVLNAADFGVPQTRRRAILVARRDRSITAPEPTHCRGGAVGLFGELAPWVSMAEALGWGATERCSPTIHAGKTGDGRVYGSDSHGSALALERERERGAHGCDVSGRVSASRRSGRQPGRLPRTGLATVGRTFVCVDREGPQLDG